MLTAELLMFPPTPRKVPRRLSTRANTEDLTAVMFNALLGAARQAGVAATATTTYQGQSDWLVVYGPGAPDRLPSMTAQRARGGRVICWDAPYWDRGRKLRVSIDHPHPQAFVLRRDWPAARLASDGIVIFDDWNPGGPTLVAGIGNKARIQYGEATVAAWEAEMVAACRAQWPGRPVYYRPKPNHAGTPPPGAEFAAEGPIEHILRGIGLVITWHSNVAIDALRRGIPVVCRDGAAAAACPSTLPLQPTPLDHPLRARLLANLAWFQWAPSEASAAWHFLREVTQ